MYTTSTMTPPPRPGTHRREQRIGPTAVRTATDGASPPADAVLDAGLASFPASDPPSWSPLRAGAPGA